MKSSYIRPFMVLNAAVILAIVICVADALGVLCTTDFIYHYPMMAAIIYFGVMNLIALCAVIVVTVKTHEMVIALKGA